MSPQKKQQISTLTFYCTFTLCVLLFCYSLVHLRFDIDAQCAEIYRKESFRLCVSRIGVIGPLNIERWVRDVSIDGIASLSLNIVHRPVHNQK